MTISSPQAICLRAMLYGASVSTADVLTGLN